MKTWILISLASGLLCSPLPKEESAPALDPAPAALPYVHDATGDTAEAYVHEEIPAEVYVHEEPLETHAIAAEAYTHTDIAAEPYEHEDPVESHNIAAEPYTHVEVVAEPYEAEQEKEVVAPMQLAGFPYLTSIIPYNHLFVLPAAAKQEAEKESAQSPAAPVLAYAAYPYALPYNGCLNSVGSVVPCA